MGIKVLGAQRWVDFGFISFQPSEFIKLSLCVFLAKVYSKNESLIAYLVPIALSVFLIMLQPDLGTTMVLLSFAISQIFLSGVPLLSFTILTIVTVS